MAESHGFIKILPDSTGKRIPHGVMVEINYDNGTVPIALGDVITGVTSGMSGTVIESTGTTASGNLHLVLDGASVPAAPAFTVGENLQVLGSTVAKAATIGYPFYFQQSQLAGGKDPTHLLEIDKKGAAYTRFAEGSPSFDAFGKMLVAQQTTVAEYLHKYGIDLDRVSYDIVGTGAIAHIPESSGMLLSVGTDSGALVEVASHFYHPYNLGMGRVIEFTSACGDAGKSGLKRIWGYGDNSDGCFFMQYNGIWYVRIKTSAGGTADLTFQQSEWNGDRLDGSGGVFNRSGILFDLTKMNISWIDLQWLGIGTVRFGVIVDGERIICHSWHHGNIEVRPYMRTGSLPIYHEVKNQTATGSASEFRVWCTVVKNGGVYTSASKDFSYVPTLKTITSTTPAQLCSLRAKAEINSITNRKSSYPSEIVVHATTPVIIEVWKNPVLTTPDWAGATSATAALEFDETTAGVTLTNARRLFSDIVGANSVTKLDLMDVFNSRDEGVRRHFNPANYDLYTITARLLAGSTSTTVQAVINWDDV